MNFTNEVPIRPCIVSKARFALKLKIKKPINDRTCSKEYWIKTIEKLGDDYGLSRTRREAAIRNRIYRNE